MVALVVKYSSIGVGSRPFIHLHSRTCPPVYSVCVLKELYTIRRGCSDALCVASYSSLTIQSDEADDTGESQ